MKPGSSSKPKKRKITEGVLPKAYCPVQQPIPSSTFASSLVEQMTAINSDAQILKVLQSNSTDSEVVSKFGSVPKGSVLSYQQKPSPSAHSDIVHPQHPETLPELQMPTLDMNYSTVLNHNELSLFMGLYVDDDIATEIERQTRDQSHNKKWHDVCENRTTSSVFKNVCCRKADFQSLSNRLLNKKNIQTAAMKRGLEYEPLAAKSYSEITGNSVYLCGFVINPSAPHLGTSPDRIVYDPSNILHCGLLEIKCPDKENFSMCKYLTKSRVTDTYRLKTNHEYYFQVMGQMALTGYPWCDFFVKCKDDYHLERIHLDTVFWEGMKDSLDKFWFEHYVPEIVRRKEVAHV